MARDSAEDLLEASITRASAFEELARVQGKALHAYLARRAGTAVADDLLAEVWLAAFASRSTYDRSLGTARGWLYGVARLRLLEHYRLQQRDARTLDLLAVESWDEWAQIDERLDAQTIAPALRAALATMDGADRELVLLLYWEELSPTDAAHVLGIPAGTARSRMHRIRRQLREKLQTSPTSVNLQDYPGRQS